MREYKGLITTFIVVVIFGGLYFIFSSEDIKETKKSKITEKKEIQVKDNIKKEEIKIKKDIKEDKANIKEEGKEKMSSKYIENAFEENDIENIAERYPYKSDVKPVSGYSFLKKSIKNLSVNDTLVLPEINGERFEIKATKRIENSDGSVSITGNVNELDNKNYFAVMTEGKNSSFITLYSPEGVFEFESRGTDGYIYNTKDIKRKRIDYSKPDFLVPKTKNK